MSKSSRSRRAVVTAAGAAVLAGFASTPAAATVGSFNASKDNTLYENSAGTLSNGSGDFVFAGRTDVDAGGIRRALLAFDLISIPADATVNAATLSLYMSRSNVAATENVSVHRVLADWGEGSSHAGGEEGGGVQATTGDATWQHRFYNTVFWANDGGDFTATPTATTAVGSNNDFYTWSSAQLAADVQNWLTSPGDNFGWILTGNETAIGTAKRFNSRTNDDVNRRPRLFIDYTAIASWMPDADGVWSLGSNWTTGAAPNGVGVAARMGGNITQPRTVTLDLPVTLGTLQFDSGHAYTIAGTNALSLDASTGGAVVNVISGSHTIAAPVTLADTTSFNVNSATSILTLTSAPTAAAGVAVNKNGPGGLHVARVRADALSINAGKVKVIASGATDATSVVKSLTIAGGATPTAQFDLSDNAMVIDYDAGNSPIQTVRAQVTSGYNSANWDGPGIICSGPGSGTTYGMGYAEASSVFGSFPADFRGVSVDDTSILLRRTRYGDVNLDGTVNLIDFNRLAANFGLASGAVWGQGDFSYDGAVNLSDFNRLAGNFGQSAGPDGVVDPEDWANLASAVPEPTHSVLMMVALTYVCGRRRTPTRAAPAASLTP